MLGVGSNRQTEQVRNCSEKLKTCRREFHQERTAFEFTNLAQEAENGDESRHNFNYFSNMKKFLFLCLCFVLCVCSIYQIKALNGKANNGVSLLPHRNCSCSGLGCSCSVSCLDKETPSCTCGLGNCLCTCLLNGKVTYGIATMSALQKSNSIQMENYFKNSSIKNGLEIAKCYQEMRQALENNQQELYRSVAAVFETEYSKLTIEEKAAFENWATENLSKE